MKRSPWFAYAIAAPSAPLLYGLIVLFVPSITTQDEFNAVTWFVSLLFFTGVSYLACLAFGGPLIYILKKKSRLRFWWVVLPGSFLYSLALYLTLFVFMDAQLTAGKIYVVSAFLLAGFGLGFIVATLFCFLSGIATNLRLISTTVIIAGLAGLFLVAFLGKRSINPDRWVYSKEFKTSALIIQEAEAFRSSHGRIPDEDELASAMEKYGWEPSGECPCYGPISDSTYEVWFGYATVGTSLVYHSEKKSWDVEG